MNNRPKIDFSIHKCKLSIANSSITYLLTRITVNKKTSIKLFNHNRRDNSNFITISIYKINEGACAMKEINDSHIRINIKNGQTST